MHYSCDCKEKEIDYLPFISRNNHKYKHKSNSFRIRLIRLRDNKKSKSGSRRRKLSKKLRNCSKKLN